MCLDFAACSEFNGLPPAFFGYKNSKFHCVPVTRDSTCPNIGENSEQHVYGGDEPEISAGKCHLKQHCKEINKTLFRVLVFIFPYADWNKFHL